jgi:hypothetical protein
MGYVPRLEPLEDRNLPSVLPTVILSDGTVLQMTAATNALIALPNQGTTNLASNSTVAVTIAYSPQGNFAFVRAADLGSFNPNSLVTAAQWSGNTPGLSTLTISTTVFLSGSAMLDQPLAMNYTIAVQTRFSQSDADLTVTIEGFDPRGNPSSAYTTAVQSNSPVPTNPVPLPMIPDSGKEIFDVNTPQVCPSGLDGNIVNQPFPGLSGDQSNTVAFAMNGTNFISIFTLIQELDAGNLLNQPVRLLPNEIPPDNSGKMNFTPPITNATSLVLADTGSNAWLTLSIIQDSYLRSTSATAQITWTGLRGPAEAPVHRAAGGRAAEFLLESITAPSKELGSAANVEISLSSQTRARPMEAMVSDILSSLQQAKRDEKGQEESLAALPVPMSADEKSKTQASLDWPLAGTVVGLLGTANMPGGDDFFPVPGLSDESPSLALIPENGDPPPGDRPESDPPRSSRTASERLAWIHLAEGVGGFLLLLAWPAVVDLGLGGRGTWQRENDVDQSAHIQ